MFFNQYPYLNLNDLNLDFILKTIGELRDEVYNFVSINALKYANPIQWNITTQYEKNTIVIDPQSGTAYISVQPVPNGIALTNTDYWTVVFDLEQFVTKANNNFTVRVEELTTINATFPTNIGEWVVWGGVLYEAIANIIAGDQYVVDSNIKRITVEEYINKIYDVLIDLQGQIGDLADLNTTNKSNLVAAINEILTALNDEVTARQNADLTLQRNIDAEVLARQGADSTLRGDIDAEVLARQGADNTLQGNIDAETLARQGADNTLQGNIDAEVLARQGADNAINLRIDSIEESIGDVLARKFLFLGDSYYLGTASIAMTNEGWADFVIEFLGLTPDQYVKASLDDVVGIPHAIATPGFSPSAGVHRSFKTILESCYNRIGQDVAETITDVVVAGGYNDIDKNDILDGISQYATFAKAAFPHAKLWCAEIGNAGGPLTYSTARQKLFTVVRPTYTMCNRYGMIYIDSAEYILDDSTQFLSNSPAHPTVAGYKLIGQAIGNALIGGTHLRPPVGNADLTITDPNWSVDVGNIKKTTNKYGEKTIVSENGITLLAASTVTVGPFEDITIKCACTGILPSGFNQKPVVLAVVHNGSYTQANVPVMLSFEYDPSASLIMRFRFSNSSTFSVNALRVRAFEYDYPSYRV